MFHNPVGCSRPARQSFANSGPIVYRHNLASGNVLAMRRGKRLGDSEPQGKHNSEVGLAAAALTLGNVARQHVAALVRGNRRHLGLIAAESKAHDQRGAVGLLERVGSCYGRGQQRTGYPRSSGPTPQPLVTHAMRPSTQAHLLGWRTTSPGHRRVPGAADTVVPRKRVLSSNVKQYCIMTQVKDVLGRAGWGDGWVGWLVPGSLQVAFPVPGRLRWEMACRRCQSRTVASSLFTLFLCVSFSLSLSPLSLPSLSSLLSFSFLRRPGVTMPRPALARLRR